MEAQSTSTSRASQVERFDDWETIENPPSSDNIRREQWLSTRIIGAQPPPEGETYLDGLGYKSVSKFRYAAQMKKKAFAQRMQQLDLGGSSDVFLPPLTPTVNTARKDAASIAMELGYSGSVSSLPQSLQIAINNRFTRQDLAGFKEEAELNFAPALPYFFSGSFIFPSCLRAITDGTTLLSIAKSMTPAILRGHNRFAVKSQPWPAMLPSTNPNDSVTGLLVFGMLQSQRRAIHRFEGGMFDLRLTKAEIELKDGERVVVDTGVYIWNRDPNKLIGKEIKEWQVEDLLESSWFDLIIGRAEEEEKLLEQADLSSTER